MWALAAATCHWLSPSVSSASSVFAVVVASVLKSNRLHFALRQHLHYSVLCIPREDLSADDMLARLQPRGDLKAVQHEDAAGVVSVS